jgi:hypothetical protein
VREYGLLTMIDGGGWEEAGSRPIGACAHLRGREE